MSHEVYGTYLLDDGREVTGRFITPAGLAARLGVSYRAVMKHVEAGHVRVLRVQPPPDTPPERQRKRVLITPREATRVEKQYRRNADWVPRARRGRREQS